MSSFRYKLVIACVSFCFLVIAGRLAYVQLFEGFKHAAAVRNNNQPDVNVLRSEIVDRNNKVLALDLTKYTLEYNPCESKENKTELIRKLNQIVHIKKPQLIYGNSSAILALNLNREEAKAIKKLGSQFLHVRRTRVRFYPQESLASHIIGYVDIYGKARQGIEAIYDKQLQDDPESQKLELSIDSRIQVFAEKVLEERVLETHSEKGSAIVMDVHTGEILAWATVPKFNPNRYYEASLESTKNWALVDTYQPGSIFKIITVSTALDSGIIPPDYHFTDQGFIEVDRWKIKNHDYNPSRPKIQELDLKMLFANSSNPFSAHLGLKIGRETFYKYIRRFGFANKSGIELTGETKGSIKNAKAWCPSDTATTAIGHGVLSVTPLQMITAINAIANDGILVRPTIIKIKEESNKNQIEKNPNQIISPETARIVRSLLTQSILYNTTKRQMIAGNVQGMSIAGKTGTAEKHQEHGGYSKSQTVASFIGFYPAENPKFITLVVIDNPKTDGGWGDTVAGPVFNKIAAYVKEVL